MHVSSPENCDIDILENGRTVKDVIDNKIKELGSMDNEEPFYVANLDSVYKRHLRWLTSLPRVKPFYAVKCNNTAAVLRMMRALDTGFDCASKAEIQMALSLGVTPDNIIYAHTTKPLSHIKYACAHGVDMMTFDSEDELLKVSCCHAKAKLVLRTAVDDSKSLLKLSSKFGARLVSVGKLLERAGELGLDVIGVSFHVGSGCTEGSTFKQAIADARHVFDIAFSEVINGALDEFFPPDSGVQIIAEPGRYYVESAFTLAANVIAKRIVSDDVDEHSDCQENSPGRMMYYLNDGVFGSLSCIVHDPAHPNCEPYLHRVVESSERRYRSVIWGPTCDSFDKVIDNYWIPELRVGDWLLLDNMGAYSLQISAGEKENSTVFWTMGGYYGLAVLVGVSLLLTTGQCDVSCSGLDGRPGERGAPGRDGYPGAKGEKGEPVVMVEGPVDPGVLLRLKGEIGNRGSQGVMGPKGYRGALGTAGSPGTAGRPGPDGKSIGHGGQQSHLQARSAFSVIRTDRSYPRVGQVVTFQNTVVNTPEDFNAATGHFTCRVSGVYYFTFHSVAKVSVCLYIASDALLDKLGFCDYNRNSEQVLSGGVVLQLTARQKVWLESFKDQQRPSELTDSQEKQIIFSGFLLFANTE
ncbi:hypothetical protein PFLUV_G00038650 [Perca fluviatilis]|uniref:C1q domain-containing protein n=2 Tax=Perca fluviatilis TaxID=8168 RepID=A0A6A5EP34_PERFL|nr:hypothetical protein PFLUV_G00038650 [Perca fluviatilis]